MYGCCNSSDVPVHQGEDCEATLCVTGALWHSGSYHLSSVFFEESENIYYYDYSLFIRGALGFT